jgi:coatomer protein complex subunit gamma
MSYGKKDEDADMGLVKVDRTQVFQEARLFNNSPIQPRQCRILLTKIALLLYTGENFPTNEATTLFFGISKLFQNKDASLRQMVHLVIKELANSAEDIIMVTSTIMKDTGGGSDAIFRPNAIRALCRIIDATTVQSIERVMKTAIVDKNPSVSSAALVSSYHLLPIAKDVVKRWQSETQEAAASTKSSGGFSLGFSSSGSQVPINNSTMTQYHAIGLLYQMRMHDRMALVKMVQQFGAAGAVKSPAALVMLVRLAAQLAEDDPSLRKPMMQLLDAPPSSNILVIINLYLSVFCAALACSLARSPARLPPPPLSTPLPLPNPRRSVSNKHLNHTPRCRHGWKEGCRE